MGEEADAAAASSSSTASKFDSAKEAHAVLKEAVDRYLRSPSSHKKKRSEKHDKATASSAKENGHENEPPAMDDVVVLDDDSTDDDVDAEPNVNKDSDDAEDTDKRPAAAATSYIEID
jgi:hypothetical protein